MRRVQMRATMACVAVVALGGIAAGCGSSDSDSGSSGGSSGNEDFHIGAGLALTGGFAGFDQPALTGIKLGVKEVNAKGGLLGKHKIVLDVKDVRSDPGQAVINTKALLQAEPSVLIAACMTDAAIPQGRLAQADKVPTFSTCATSTTLTTSVGNFMFGNFPTDTFEAAAAARHASGEGYKTAFLISSAESSYTANVPKAFKAAFTAEGGKVVGESNFTFNQQDFSPIVTKIKNMSPQPDVVETAMFEPAFPAFMKQLRAAGVKVPVIGAAGIDTPSVVGGGKEMEGIVFPTLGFAEDGNPQAEFDKKVEATAGKESVTGYATRGYDLITTIQAAVESAKSTEPEKIRDAIAKLKDVQGISTTTTYDYPGANGLPLINPSYMVMVKGGKKELIDKVELEASDVPGMGE
jgi:branched-chain amino acid transport system substrate-binding protein